MKLFKKAKQLFDKMTGRAVEVPPPVRPPPTPTVEAEVVLDPRYKYRREQRDFEARAKATRLIWDSRNGPYRRGAELLT